MNAKRSNTLGSALRGFFTDFLPKQKALSPHTIESYRDGLKLMLQFVAGATGDPSLLTVEDLTTDRVTAFLQHLEAKRNNSARTRNVRLSAVHSFFRYLGGHYPQYLDHSQRVLSIPFKRTASREIQHLECEEIQAILKRIDQRRGEGERDFVLLTLLFNTGARVSEIVDLQATDLRLTPPSSVLLRGKGKKERVCPLWPETVKALRRHLESQSIGIHESRRVFNNSRGHPLTRFGIRWILQKHVREAAIQIPSLKRKRLHPHSWRHSTAVHLLRSGVDLSTIAHLLGHASVNTTNKYATLDLESKREALSKTKPILPHRRRFSSWRSDQSLIQWLESL